MVAAHPDDEVLGCGGLIAHARKRRAACRVLILGEGSTCRFASSDPHDPPAAAAIGERRSAALAAAEILGGPEMIFRELPCGRFDQVPVIEIGKLIEHEIDSFEPDMVVTHSFHDVNNDHRLAFQATLQATRPGTKGLVSSVLSCEIPSSSEWRFVETFRPQFFLPIPDEIDQKIAALACYGTEQRPYPFPRSAEGLRAHAMVRGMQSAAHFAEAFEIVRVIAPCGG